MTNVFFDNSFVQCLIANTAGKKIYDFFLNNDVHVVHQPDAADIILINTCIAVELNRRNTEVVIQKYLPYRSRKTVIAYGCVAGIKQITDKYPGIIYIGVKEMQRLEEIINARKHLSSTPCRREDFETGMYHSLFPFTMETYFKNPKITSCIISRGCTNACAYCDTRKTIGYVKSRRPEEIVEEVRSAVTNGYDEVFLASDDSASYGADIDTNFCDLLNNLLCSFPKIGIHVHVVYPEYLVRRRREVINIFKSGRILSIVIPLQSMSERLIRLMNRRYNPFEVMETVAQLRKTSPRTIFMAHFIYCYPTETKAEFMQMCDHAELFNGASFHKFSPPLERLIDLPQIEPQVQERRVRFVKERFMGKPLMFVPWV